MKKLLATGVLTIFGLSLLSAGTPRAKSYDITIVTITKAGSVQLKPGLYKVKVEGTSAIFTDVNSSKTLSTPVKIETGDKKFDDTTVQITNEGGTARLDEIDLGGSKTKLEF